MAEYKNGKNEPLRPEQVNLIEKTRDADFYRRVRVHPIGREGAHERGESQYTLKTHYAETNLTDIDLNRIVGAEVDKPDLGRRIERKPPDIIDLKPPTPPHSKDI
jgi:hypothetical protein